MLNIDNINFDLNAIFTFQESFSQLKRLIETLAKAHSKSESRLAGLELILSKVNPKTILKRSNTQSGSNKNVKWGTLIREVKQEDMEGNTQSGSNKNVKWGTSIREGKQEDMESNADIQMDLNQSQFDNSVHINVDEHVSRMFNTTQKEVETSDLLSRLTKRVAKLEKDASESSKTSQDLYEVKKLAGRSENEVHQHSLLIKEMRTRLEELSVRTDANSESIEKLNLKVMDFNIYDMFKSNGNSGIDTSDEAKILIQNLDNKITQKLSFVDKKFKVQEEEIMKNRNEIGNVKSTQEGITRNVDGNAGEIEKLQVQVTEHHSEFTIGIEKLENSENQNYAKLILITNERERELKDLILSKDEESRLRTTQENLNYKSSSSEKGLGEGELKLIRDINKRLTDLDKSYRVFSSALNVDWINAELIKVNELILGRVKSLEFHDLKESVNGINYQLNLCKDTISQVLEDRKAIDDVNWLRKKVEALASNFLIFKNENSSSSERPVNAVQKDNSKYLEMNIFTEFQKVYNRELDNMSKAAEDQKRLLDDILNVMKTKASDKDLKNLEEYLITKQEELRLNSNKKFADKTDTQKNIKYVDAQVKHIMDVYVKKMEKGDNWLIAKKPVNGFACASCESYIGDLNDKTTDYLPWNKYPIRDPNEKAYRMLNLDVKKGEGGNMVTNTNMNTHLNTNMHMHNNPQFTEAAGEGSDEDISNGKLILPHLNCVNNLDMSAENFVDGGDCGDAFKPKV